MPPPVEAEGEGGAVDGAPGWPCIRDRTLSMTARIS
jgi:hypothetical protein